MKLTAAFEKFLEEEVNLNRTRINTLTERVQGIESFLEESDWRPTITRFSAQGSWAHKTIIKPPGMRGFDADLLVFVSPVAGWSAADYVLNLRSVFSASDAHKDRAGLGNRCVTLEYAGDFEIDVVPCIEYRPDGSSRYEVCNRTEDKFEATDSEAYTLWFHERDVWTGNTRLRQVTRLLKYLRDIKLTFSCKSILLSTLLGERVTAVDALFQSTYFPDLPTALRTLVARLDDYLQARPDLHAICNPVLPNESFIRHWDNDKYANFREMIHKYRGWIDEAYEAPDEAESTTKWQRVFGDEFNRGSKATIAKIAESAVVPIAVNRFQYKDAVQFVQQAGRAALANVQAFLPWMKSPQWRMSLQSQVVIRATVHRDRSGNLPIGEVGSGEILSKNLELHFEALMPNGLSYAGAKDFDVQWQVVNTDQAAWQNNGLRGGFYASYRRAMRWESTRYRGVHWVEAFVIRRRDRVCIARSGRFFIVIE